jgi:hypothetical protein
MRHRANSYWYEQSRDAIAARDNEEWKTLGYKSFGAYLDEALGEGKSTIYLGMGTLEKLKEMPAEIVSQMSLENAATVAKLPEKERDAETVAAACTKPGKDLRSKVRKEKAHLHLDFSETVSFKVHETAIQVIDRAIEKIMEMHQLTAKGAALEYLCKEWMDGDVSIEQHEAVRNLFDAVEDSVVPGVAVPTPKAMFKIYQLTQRVGRLFHYKPREIGVPPAEGKAEAGRQPRVN